MNPTIIVHDAVVKGSRVQNRLEINDPDIRKVFLDLNFYAEYDADVSKVPLGVLNVPALSTVVHLAMAAGLSVKAGEVDDKYLRGIGDAQAYLGSARGYESLKMTAEVDARPVDTSSPTGGKGLLFSGGCDSTSSYVRRMYENPTPIMIWGLDIPTTWTKLWAKTAEKYAWMRPRTIKSNTEDIYSPNALWAYGSKLKEGYRPTYSFSINALGVCAPLAYAEGMGELMLSSTYPSRHFGDPRHPWAKDRPSFIVNQFWRWGSTRCMEVDHEFTTYEKVKHILKPHFTARRPLFLRSCGHRATLMKYDYERLNCEGCDKCGRVIGMLATAGIDPRTCGFPHADGATYARIRSDIETKRWNPIYLKYHWEEVRSLIPDPTTEDYGGSKAFLEWLRGYRFEV